MEQRLAEREMFHMAAVTCTKAIREVEEPCILEANAMVPPQQEEPVTDSNTKTRTNDDNLTVASSTAKELPVPFVWQNNVDGESHPNLEKLCRKAYPSDRIFKKILSHPKDHKSFEVRNGLIHYSADAETRRLCIPRSEFRGRRLTELVIDQVHQTVGHMGTRITKNYACRYFWWPDLESDVKSFCESCSKCQAMKTSNQRPQGLLHSLPMPTKPWSSIGMDFVGPFPLVDNFNYVWAD
jgi:phage pi2 protein 07